jgi:uncharacterized protein with beta-barrel porin domain
MKVMKKTLQSILLFLVASSTLFAQNYERSTEGFWGDPTKWTNDHGTSRVPNGSRAIVTLRNITGNILGLNLNNENYTIGELNAFSNAAWNLSNGILTFRQAISSPSKIEVGRQTLIFGTSLNLLKSLQINTYEDTETETAGTVQLLNQITGKGPLTKLGPGTLLIEAPIHLTEKNQLLLKGGTTGVVSINLNKLNFFVSEDSNLFAFDRNANITGNLNIYPRASLNIIDNPYDSQPGSIIFSGDESGEGTINQLSHNRLIFENTDDFKGTINTSNEYGLIVLNGNTGANIRMDGGKIAGTGGTRGRLSARNGAIISPGSRATIGTLTFGNVFLDPSTVLNFRFNNRNNDQVQVNRDLTLGGKLNIKAETGLENGMYSLFHYTGRLTKRSKDLIISIPSGYDPSHFAVETGTKGQVDLVVGPPGAIQVWNGGNNGSSRSIKKTLLRVAGLGLVAAAAIVGGSGDWTPRTTWNSTTGLSPFNGSGVFAGDPGTVNLTYNASVHELEFLTNDKIHSSNDSMFVVNAPTTNAVATVPPKSVATIPPTTNAVATIPTNSLTTSSNAGTPTPVANPAIIKVDNTYQADISVEITGTGSVEFIGLGTVFLSHSNSYMGGSIINSNLVANTPHALSNGPVIVREGQLLLGKTRILEVGNYAQDRTGTLVLRANPTNHDQLVVNGNATLGGTLLLRLEGGGRSPNLGKQMTLITTQGLNGSRFDNIQLTHTSLERLSANYDTNNVYVTSQFDPIYPYAMSHNAQALAGRLDLFSNTSRDQELFDSLANLSLPQVPAALEKLVPGQVFALSSIGLSVSRSHMHSLQGRLDDLNSGYASYGELNISPSQQYGLSLAGASVQTNFLMNKDQDLWNFYMRGNGGFGRQSQDIENEIPGYDYGQGGTFIGAEYRLNDKVYVGGAVSYTYTDASFHDDRGSLSTNSYFGHLYAAYAQPKGFNLISSLSLGNHEFDLRRRVLTDTAHSQPQSREVDFQSQISYNIPLKPNLTVSPYAGLAYSAFWMNGFQEYSSEANLKISHDQTNSLRSTVGVKAQYEKPFTKGIRKASIEANLAWEHEYFDAQTRGINAEWVGSGVPSFQVQRGRIAPDTLISGVNLRLAVTNLLSVITGYDIEANRGYISHNFNVGVNFTF